MKNYQIYFKLLCLLRETQDDSRISQIRFELQDVLCELRERVVKDLQWTSQEVQDFFEGQVTARYRMNRPCHITTFDWNRLDREVQQFVPQMSSDYYGDDRAR